MSHPPLWGHRITPSNSSLLLLLLLLHVLLIGHLLMLFRRHTIATHWCDGLGVCGTAHIGCLCSGGLGSGLLLLLLGGLGSLGV